MRNISYLTDQSTCKVVNKEQRRWRTSESPVWKRKIKASWSTIRWDLGINKHTCSSSDTSKSSSCRRHTRERQNRNTSDEIYVSVWIILHFKIWNLFSPLPDQKKKWPKHKTKNRPVESSADGRVVFCWSWAKSLTFDPHEDDPDPPWVGPTMTPPPPKVTNRHKRSLAPGSGQD